VDMYCVVCHLVPSALC